MMADYYQDVQMADLSQDFSSRAGGLGGFRGPKSTDEDRKLFLGGLSYDTEEQDIVSYFTKFGQVANVNIKYDNVTGKPRGFGFITFSSASPVETILQNGPHMIRNRTVDTKRPRARPAFKKIFVGGIDAEMPEDEIKDYFTRFGSVEGIECPFDRQRGRRREFCFIIFDTEEAAEAAITEPKQMIGNKECDVKKAQPQKQQTPAFGGYGAPQQRRGWSTGYGQGAGGGAAWSNNSGFSGYPAPANVGYSKTFTNSNYYNY